jgi:hypothetical protein
MKDNEKHYVHLFAGELVEAIKNKMEYNGVNMQSTFPPMIGIFYHLSPGGEDFLIFEFDNCGRYFTEEGKDELQSHVHALLDFMRSNDGYPFAVLVASDAYKINRDVDAGCTDDELYAKATKMGPVSKLPDRQEAIIITISGEDWEELRQYPYVFENGKPVIIESIIDDSSKKSWKDFRGLFANLYKK